MKLIVEILLYVEQVELPWERWMERIPDSECEKFPWIQAHVYGVFTFT